MTSWRESRKEFCEDSPRNGILAFVYGSHTSDDPILGSVGQEENNKEMFKAKFTLEDDAFRQLLKDLRIEKDLSQRELARRLKVPQSYVSKYETGERRLDFVETVYVCEALGISIEEFVRKFSRRMTKRRRQKDD